MLKLIKWSIKAVLVLTGILPLCGCSNSYEEKYMDDKRVVNAGVASFKVLGENYDSDNKHVFYKMQIVNGADPKSFKVYPHDVGDAGTEDRGNKYHQRKNVNGN